MPAVEYTLSQLKPLDVTRALATITNLRKLAALVKVSGDQLPVVYNGGYSPRERLLLLNPQYTSEFLFDYGDHDAYICASLGGIKS